MSKFRHGRRFFCELQNLLATLSRLPRTIVLIVTVLSGQMSTNQLSTDRREIPVFGMMYYLWLNEWKSTDVESAVMGAPGSSAHILFLTISTQLSVSAFFFLLLLLFNQGSAGQRGPLGPVGPVGARVRCPSTPPSCARCLEPEHDSPD